MQRRGMVGKLGIVLLAAVLALVLLLPPGGAMAAEAGPIKVGWLGILSGTLAPYGIEHKTGVEYAVEKINAGGGIKGAKVEMIYTDSKFDINTSVQAVRRFAQQDKVAAIIGGISSAVTIATVGETARLKVPQIAGLAGTPKITEMGSQWIFRTYPSVILTYSSLAHYAIDKLGHKKFATLAYNDEGGLSSIEVFVKTVKEKGKGEIVAREVVPLDAKEFKGVLAKMRQQNPDALVMAAAAPVSGLVARQAREMGWNVALLGHGGYQGIQQYRDVAGPAGDGTLIVTTYAPGLFKHKEAQEFVKEWQAKFKRMPKDLEAHGYDAMNMLAEAIGKVGPDRQKIRDYLAGLKNWPGAAGIYSFLPTGDIRKSLVVSEWKAGNLTPVVAIEKTD
ncbi:MAG: ABC transporter substrate-binding protein [Candidatus Tectomicrobia bacterium]|nr:ABC transporter substrate-binding protein [Candidatus Tectomicrobia bacterium]